MSSAQDRDYQPQSKIQETPEWDGRGFDLRVLIKDGKTGEVIRHQPYNRHCVGAHVYYERPPGSGNLVYGDGKPAGRWMKQENGQYGAQTDLAHIEQAQPLEPVTAQAIAEENETLKQELAAMTAQVEALTKPQETESRRR